MKPARNALLKATAAGWLAVCLFTTACVMVDPCDEPLRVTESETREFVFDGSGIGSLCVETVNGIVDVSEYEDRNEIRISAEVIVRADDRFSAKEHLDEIRIESAVSDGHLTISTRQNDGEDDWEYEVRFRITASPLLRLDIRQINGQVFVSGTKKNLEIQQINGTIGFDHQGGPIKIGQINGNVDGRIALDDSSSCEVDVYNGEIDLGIAEGSSARIRARVVHGQVQYRGLPLENVHHTLSELSATLGSGAGQILLNSVNGLISLTGY